MKQLIIIICLFCFKLTIQAQDQFISNRGAADMAKFAHLTNTYNNYRSSYTSYDDYYILDLFYTDENSDGYTIETKVRLGRGIGSLYFNSINVINDNDDFPAFGALLLATSTIMEAAKESNPQEYYKSINQMRAYLNLEPENWNGADWALFLINFDYGCNCLNN